jgi:hypothetical protein
MFDSDGASSVKIDGRCIDIPTTTVRKACMMNQPGAVLLYGTSGSCDDRQLIASLVRGTECMFLSTSDRIGSVKVDGKCIDIDLTPARLACILHRP